MPSAAHVLNIKRIHGIGGSKPIKPEPQATTLCSANKQISLLHRVGQPSPWFRTTFPATLHFL